MLKRNKKIITTKKSTIVGAEEWLEIDDKFRNDNQQILFNKIFIETKEYTINELCKETNYSERSIFRKISGFEKLIKIIGEMQESLEKNKKES